jgi:hypothetical protein
MPLEVLMYIAECRNIRLGNTGIAVNGASSKSRVRR